MATPTVEVPWHQHPSTCTYSSPKLSLKSTSSFSSPTSRSQGHQLPLNSLLSTTPIGTRHSPMSGCGTPLNFVSNSNIFERRPGPAGTQTSSLFRVGVFNPLLSRCLIQMHLNRILYSQPPTFYSSFSWNVLLNVRVQTHSEQPNPHPSAEHKKSSAVRQESDTLKGQTQAEAQDKPSTGEHLTLVDSMTDIEEAHFPPQQAQLPSDTKQIHGDTIFPAPTQIPFPITDSQEDQSTVIVAETPHAVSVVNPQMKSGSFTNEVVAWQPEDQREHDSNIKAVNCDISVANDSGSELPCGYAIHVSCPEEEDQADDYSDGDMESECELYESDSDDEEDDDFIEFSDESFEAATSNPGATTHTTTHQLTPHPKRYVSLLSAESGYFEGSGDTVPSCDEDNNDSEDNDGGGDCEAHNSVSCEALWKVFEDQAFSPVPCSKKVTTKCSQLICETKTVPTEIESNSSKLCDSSLNFATTFKQCIEADAHSEEASDHPSVCVKTKPTKVKCVRFKPDSELVEVHHMVSWSYAYRASRKCFWEQFACDRMRFKRRVSNLAPILEPCLAKKVAKFCSSRNFNSHCVFVR